MSYTAKYKSHCHCNQIDTSFFSQSVVLKNNTYQWESQNQIFLVMYRAYSSNSLEKPHVTVTRLAHLI